MKKNKITTLLFLVIISVSFIMCVEDGSFTIDYGQNEVPDFNTNSFNQREGSAGLTITKTDVDGDGNPVGIATTVTTGSAATGSLTVILKHEPTKPNDGTATGAGGSTDVEVSYSIEVQ